MARSYLPGCWQAPGRGPRPASRAAAGRRGAMRVGASTLDVGRGGRGSAAAGQVGPNGLLTLWHSLPDIDYVVNSCGSVVLYLVHINLD
jgi:hypothetical protein